MNPTPQQQVANLEAEAHRFAKLAQSEFSPINARHLRGTADKLMQQAQEIRTADLEDAAAKARRHLADGHIARINVHVGTLERDGRHREAQEAVDAAYDWDFWATYGVMPSQWDAANADDGALPL